MYDLRTLSYDKLEVLLHTAYTEIVPFSRCTQEIKQRKQEFEDEANMSIGCFTVGIILLIGWFCWLIFDGKNISNDTFAIVASIVSVLLFVISLSIFLHNRKKKKQLATEIADLMKDRECAINNFKAILFIPDRYSYEKALQSMIGYLQEKRASNWERCTDLYEEFLHRSTMQGLAEQRLRQSELQTELLKQTRDASRWTAAGAWASAAGVWHINSKL